MAAHPDLIFRLLGYGGLVLLASLRLWSEPTPMLWLLLLVSLLWPGLWWWAVCRWQALRSPRSPWTALSHAVECLLILALIWAVQVEVWFLFAAGLLGLAGVTALGGLRLLLPCALAVAAVLALTSWEFLFQAVADGFYGQDDNPDGNNAASLLLIVCCLLGLAWQSYYQVRRLRQHRARALSETSRLRDRNERLARYLPEDLNPLIGDTPGTPQRPKEEFVTVAFVDLVGFAELVVAHGVAEVMDVLNDFMALVTQLTQDHGGVVGKFLGDGVLVYFPENDDPDPGKARATAAISCACLALALSPGLETMATTWRRRGLTVRLRARVGIASGYCALGDWGGEQRMDYTLIGTPVNLASRLQALAEPGGVMLSSPTAALLALDPELIDCLAGRRLMSVKGIGAVMVHELSASAKVRAIPLPVRAGQPDS